MRTTSMPGVAENTLMLDSLWTRLLGALEPRMQAAALESWIRPCRLVAMDSDHLRVAAPNDYSRGWVTQHHLATLESAARDVLGGNPA